MKANIHNYSYLAHVFLEWERLRTKVLEQIKTHILCSITFFENSTGYDTMWKFTVQPGRPQMATLRICILCWISKAKQVQNL